MEGVVKKKKRVKQKWKGGGIGRPGREGTMFRNKEVLGG